MSTALERIKELDREIIDAANLKSLLVAAQGDCRTDAGKNIVDDQLAMIAKRIGRAQSEIEAIERDCFAELASERRNRKYPPLPPIRRSTLQFAGEDELFIPVQESSRADSNPATFLPVPAAAQTSAMEA